MWDCPDCGCKAIAHDLTRCPMCGKEREMPKTTAEGGDSNRWEGTEDAVEAPPAATARTPRAKAAASAPAKAPGAETPAPPEAAEPGPDTGPAEDTPPPKAAPVAESEPKPAEAAPVPPPAVPKPRSSGGGKH